MEKLRALGADVDQVRLYLDRGIHHHFQVGEDWDSAHAVAEEALAEGDFLVHPHAQVGDEHLHDDLRDNLDQEDTWEGHASLVAEVAEVLGRPPACLVAAVIIILIFSPCIIYVLISSSASYDDHHHSPHIDHLDRQNEHHPDQKDVDCKVGGGGLALGLARGLDRQPGTSVHATWHKTR